ncbi:MAG: sulfite exporter TauE/SafE family protein [Alphaproteobacteria bacterium]|nr:sulfite exporter TauE/SafE family protein [Alphaproteobacteria bacterium]
MTVIQDINALLARALDLEQACIVAAVVCSLIVAGLLKGTIGVGMPVVSLPLLSFFIDIKSAAMLLSMPLILSNLPQALEGGKTGRCLMQLMPVIVGMVPGLFLGVRVLLAVDGNVARIFAGLVLIGVGGITLLAPKLQLQTRLVLPAGVVFGFFGGVLGGIAAMSGPLVFIFLLAKGLRGQAFTKEASLHLVISSGLLAILLTVSRQFNWLDVFVSALAMVPVAIGMYAGQHVRDRIAPETFKRLVLIAVIAAGAELVRHGLFH